MAKQIRCPNCNYEGKAETTWGGCALMLVGPFVVAAGVVAWMVSPGVYGPALSRIGAGPTGLELLGGALALIGVALFFGGLFAGEKLLCPRCKWQHPIHL